MPFNREDRYLVMKRREIREALNGTEQVILTILTKKVADYRLSKGKQRLQCVVVESDWPEYEEVWSMIEERCTNE